MIAVRKQGSERLEQVAEDGHSIELGWEEVSEDVSFKLKPKKWKASSVKSDWSRMQMPWSFSSLVFEELHQCGGYIVRNMMAQGWVFIVSSDTMKPI